MSTFLKGINKSPEITYRWLRVNDTTVERDEFPEVKKTVEVQTSNTESVKIEEVKKESWNEGNTQYLYSSAPMGAEFRSYVEDNVEKEVIYTVGTSSDTPIIYEYYLGEETILEKEKIIIEEDVKATILFIYRGNGSHLGIREVIAKKGSSSKVFKVNLLRDASLTVTEMIVQEEEGAEVEVISINIGKENTVDNINVSLGDKATGDITGLYLSSGCDKIDMNYTVVLKGLESRSKIDVKGALSDRADKVFRGTIDFRRGAKGAKGAQREEIMLLSDEVRNVAMPLILCGEDDVMGEHAASCGRIDENKIFYLMSRGISMEESKKIIVEGTFYPILDKIPDKNLVKEISEIMQGRLAKI